MPKTRDKKLAHELGNWKAYARELEEENVSLQLRVTIAEETAQAYSDYKRLADARLIEIDLLRNPPDETDTIG